MGLEKVFQILSNNIVRNSVNIDDRLDELILQYKDTCPIQSNIEKLYNLKNNLYTTIQVSNNNLNTIKSIINPLNTSINTASTIVTTLKSLPIPLSVPPGIGLPTSIPVNYSDLLRTVQEQLKADKGLVTQINNSLDILIGLNNNSLNKLIQFNVILDNCLNKYNISDDLKVVLLNSIYTHDTENNILNTSNSDDINYKGYILKVEFDSENKKSYPRRRVIAINELNDKVYGEFSFSSSVSILINEVKFLIDKKLIK